MKAEKPQILTEKWIPRIVAFLLVVVVLCGLWLLMVFTGIVEPLKPDGELWISDNGTRLKTTYYGHYEIQCICKYLSELGYRCSDRYMGCGAVNCECFEKDSNELKNDLILWRTGHSGGFVRGEGLVCT